MATQRTLKMKLVVQALKRDIMRKPRSWIITILMTVVMAGCEDRNQPTGPSSAATNPSPKPPLAPAGATNPNDLLGKWVGPEGTYLLLSKNADKYVIEIRSLDGLATYGGTLAGDGIEFRRNGKTEFIREGSGHDTGMKWLLEKKSCLIISELVKDSAGSRSDRFGQLENMMRF